MQDLLSATIKCFSKTTNWGLYATGILAAGSLMFVSEAHFRQQHETKIFPIAFDVATLDPWQKQTHEFKILPPEPTMTGSILATIDWQSAQDQYARIPFVNEAMVRRKSLSSLNMQKLEPSQKQQKPSKRNEIFGATLIGFGKIATGQRFSNYMARLEEGENDARSLCVSTKCEYRMANFDNYMHKQDVDFLSKLKIVNRFVNKSITYSEDREIYGTIDKWSLPDETLSRGVGDCEDFAILKMGILSKIGVPKKAMSIIVLQDTQRKLYHAVLAVRTNVGTFILDNAVPTIKKDIDIASYRPLFSVGAGKNHVFGYKRAQQKQMASALNFSKIAPGAAFTETIEAKTAQLSKNNPDHPLFIP